MALDMADLKAYLDMADSMEGHNILLYCRYLAVLDHYYLVDVRAYCMGRDVMVSNKDTIHKVEVLEYLRFVQDHMGYEVGF